ncbi:MAG TPA: HAMP domain-containing sensor histidine kinase, partial [Bacilli bacterium]|nr:HAMP domain-containing sensor histidine kinase [Bacilli bacterium]
MNRKKFIICESLTIIIFLIITITISNIQYNNYKRISNESISSLIGEIKKSYPNITDEEIIDTLNNTDDVETTMLEKYGYKDADEYSKKMANSYKLSLTESIVIPVVFILILISIYLYYRNTEEKRIKDINSYLSDINNKKYHLLIQDNNEDELSKLHNELYKTTVMLKETSEIDRLEKQKLSTALADISHQLKTPLTSIRILLDNINENPNMDDKTKNEFLSDISKQVDWMSSLIISLLKIARLDANAVSMCDKEINIKDLLDEVKENLSILLDIKNIELDIKYEGNPKINLDYQWNKEAIT